MWNPSDIVKVQLKITNVPIPPHLITKFQDLIFHEAWANRDSILSRSLIHSTRWSHQHFPGLGSCPRLSQLYDYMEQPADYGDQLLISSSCICEVIVICG